MSDLSNMYALQARQERYDNASPYDAPIKQQTYAELFSENMGLRDYFMQLLEEARDSGEKLNRMGPAAGQRLLDICDELDFKVEQL